MRLRSHLLAVSGFCIEDQQSLLLQLKNNEFKFDASWSTKLVSWNQSFIFYYCDWSGVTCDKEGRVVGLDLSWEFIDGELHNSSALFCFQHLQNLDLSHNHFNSSIPPTIGNLKNLVSLNLSDNFFAGQIPMEISQLKNLVSLDLPSSSSLKLEIPNLQQLVQNLTKIRYLYLDYVKISAQGKDWSNALLAIPSLEEVSMMGCNLFGPIDSSLERLENLSKLYLDSNDLSSIVPESFANLKKLTILSLQDCNLRGDFPHKIFQIETLSFVSILHNDNLHGSLPYFPLNGSLETLIVRKTNFTGPIPSSLFALPSIAYVDLSFNHFDGEIKPDMFQSHQYLDILDLSYNNLSMVIDANLSSFPNIFHLGLASCNLTEFPAFLRNHSTMVCSLDLSNNHIQGLIPHWIWKLQGLQWLNLSINYLTGFESMKNLTNNFYVLDLHSNELQGRIPVFSSVAYLDCSSNNFNSIIPHNIGTHLSSTFFLSLSENKFHGHIPRSLCEASLLNELDLSNNSFKGTIPACLIESEMLWVLSLGNNKLTGKIPNSFPESCWLKALDIHENQLSGLIPESLARCKKYPHCG
ncbi:receptor-like protein 6 [Prosopis cineraria]|uniref:receptor-like protein 6 n=1 Tax=Prosopis cineraria TaxID=364024 RepID=UPI00240F7BF6|nr:receptor-like protein 6 [Prosopis cineraria]